MSYTRTVTDKKEQFDRSKMREIVRGESGFPPLLYDLLHYGNPHPHEGPVRDVITKYLLANTVLKDGEDFWADGNGNLFVSVGESETLFSCHMDTVHKVQTLVYPMMQKNDKGEDTGLVFGATKAEKTTVISTEWVRSDTGKTLPADYPETLRTTLEAKTVKLLPLKGEDGVIVPDVFQVILSWDDKVDRIARFNLTRKLTTETRIVMEESILGADDKLGCYLMCEMIRANVPGLYIFHVGEECGATDGSRFIAANNKDLISPMKRAVAFDRMGYGDVITQQGGSGTASNTFGTELAAALNAFCPPFQQFKPCTNGVFTDTKVYAPIIPECTNLSVGYFKQHFHYEHFDLYWLLDTLVSAVIRVKWEELGTHRVPKEDVYTSRSYGGYSMLGDSYWSNPDEEKTFEERFKGWPVDRLNTLNAASPGWSVPVWVPKDLYLPGVKKTAMKALVEKWLFGRPRAETADAMVELLCEIEDAHAWLTAYEDQYPELMSSALAADATKGTTSDAAIPENGTS